VLFEGLPKLAVVVNFAIERDYGAMLSPPHRLRAAVAEVADCQPAVSKSHCTLDPDSFRVGTAVCERPGHAFDRLAVDRTPVEVHNPRDSAHGSEFRRPTSQDGPGLGAPIVS